MSSIILSFTWVHIADKKQPENASNAILSRGFSSENHVLGAKLRIKPGLEKQILIPDKPEKPGIWITV